MTPLFLWISYFFCGFPISYFLFFFGFSVFLLVRFCSRLDLVRPRPPNSLDAHGKKREGTRELPSALVPRPRGRGAPKLGEIEVSRDSRSVQLVFSELHIDS